jgi:hypothetical protein
LTPGTRIRYKRLAREMAKYRSVREPIEARATAKQKTVVSGFLTMD